MADKIKQLTIQEFSNNTTKSMQRLFLEVYNIKKAIDYTVDQQANIIEALCENGIEVKITEQPKFIFDYQELLKELEKNQK